MPRSWFSWLKRLYAPRRRQPIQRFNLERLEERTLLSAGPTLATAVPLMFTDFSTAQASSFIVQPNAVDLYEVPLKSGDRLAAAVRAQSAGSGLQSVLRVFDSQGIQVASADPDGGDPQLTFQAATAGDYFIGVSSAGDDAYNPNIATSDLGGTTTGLYSLNVSLTPAAPLLADVAGSSFGLKGSDTLEWGQSVSGNFTIENRGGADSTGFTVQLVLSSGTNFTGFDPSQSLPVVLGSGPPEVLAAGQAYTDSFTAQLPSAAPANFPAVSGPVYIGLVIVPNVPAQDSGTFDKSGVQRGEDFESLTIVTPVPAGTTDLSSVDPSLNTQVNKSPLVKNQVATYTFTLKQSGSLTASILPADSAQSAFQISLLGPSGQLLIQSDGGGIVQDLKPGAYSLTVTSLTGNGQYQLTTHFVNGTAPGVPISLSGSPTTVVTADLNGDGIPDLVVKSSYGLTTLLGNGDGTFQTKPIYGYSGATTLAVGDLNGDGRPDLVVAYGGRSTAYGYTPPSVSVLLGNGDGTFPSTFTVPTAPYLDATYPVGYDPTAIAIADLNGNGIPDLIVANAGNNTVSVLMGNGDGTFQPQQTFAVGKDPVALAVADLTGDGKPDLITVNNYDNTISVLLNDTALGGTLDFQPQQTYTVGSSPTAIVVGNLTGDGNPDLAVSNSKDNTISVLLGNGDGTFRAGQTVTDVPGPGR